MSKLAILGGTPVRTAPFPRYPILGEEELEAATAVIRTHDLNAQMGHAVEAFEADFAAYSGVRFAVGTSCGSTALHTAVAAAGIGAGDEVIVPAYTFKATAISVLMQNAVPIFADIEPQTLGLDPESVKAWITSRTRAVIVVHMNGYPADMDGLMDIARDHDLMVIEDCSHAHGAEYHGRKIGAVGHIGAFSCHQVKNLSLGEGGIVITDDETLGTRSRAIYNFGQAPLSYNYRMTELHGAIGRVRLRRLDEDNAVRLGHARLLEQELHGLPGLRVQQVRPDTRAVYYNFMLHYYEEELGVDRARFLEAIHAEGALMTGMMYPPVYRDYVFQRRDAYGHGFPFVNPFCDVPAEEQPRYEDGICPVTEAFCDRRTIGLKVFPTWTSADIADVAASFRKVVENIDELR